MNRVSLVGRLTTKPELRVTNSQIPYTRFSLAVNRTFTNSQGERTADFINIIAWRKQAEVMCNYLDKGSLISVGGRIQTNSYDDKDGKRVYSYDVVVDDFQFLESKSQAQARTSSGNNNFGPSPYDYQQKNDVGYDLNNANDPYSNMGDIVMLNDTDDID